jgi:2C-methyl-D-erythritol 2,4-cyclodiphosphate synthase
MSDPLYDDGVFAVTSAIVSTPQRFYPLAHTTASIRRDPLWAAVTGAMLGAACLTVYGDLLHFSEQVWIVAASFVSLLLGREFSILRITAVGHAGAVIIGRRRRIRAVYEVIRRARGCDGALHLGISQ